LHYARSNSTRLRTPAACALASARNTWASHPAWRQAGNSSACTSRDHRCTRSRGADGGRGRIAVRPLVLTPCVNRLMDMHKCMHINTWRSRFGNDALSPVAFATSGSLRSEGSAPRGAVRAGLDTKARDHCSLRCCQTEQSTPPLLAGFCGELICRKGSRQIGRSLPSGHVPRDVPNNAMDERRISSTE
jgi:hypothetical protein